MKIITVKIIIFAFIILAALAVYVIYNLRSPVIIVADLSSIPLYGENRIQSESRKASVFLFRKIKTVSIADDAAADIVTIAISDVSTQPYCVIFPLRFVRAARLYREQYPQIPVILLEGRHGSGSFNSIIGSDANDYYVYQTDIESDFYRAALAASALSKDKNGEIIVFTDLHYYTQAREVFQRTINSMEKPQKTSFFVSFSEYTEKPDISCVVLAGSGTEYMEKDTGVPVIMFTWVDPFLLPDAVVLLVDDSPWVQSVAAARMASARMTNGQIKSRFQVINRGNIDRKTLRNIPK